MPLTRKTVMISSTARDLPEHRREVMNACLSQGMFPTMMEYLPANDSDAITVSLKMVDEADIYVGVFAHRYGYIPKGHKISVTEMEYNRAAERGIPRLIFVMDKDHPIKIEDIEMGRGEKKLNVFKKKLLAENIVNQFKSSAELRAQVLNSLSKQLEATPVTISNIEASVLDVNAYFNALCKRYNVLALEGLTPPQKEEYLQIQLCSVFVEQSVREDTPPVELPKDVWEKLSREQEIHNEDLPSGITLNDLRRARESYYQRPSRLVLDALTESRNQYTIILGDPGSGKSTLARYVMLSLIDRSRTDPKIQKAFEGYLPLLIELRTFAGLCAEGKCETSLEFLEHLGKTEGWELTQYALNNYLKNDGRAVVIFDGLDEIFEPKMRESITNQIAGFTNIYPKARVIVTSRLLGYRRKILSDAGFTHFTIQDLDEKQVDIFITKWYQLAMSDRLDEAKERSERILKSFNDSASIRQLAGNPMLLTIMAIIGKHQELPRERWKLYDHAASVLIQHWDVNKHLRDDERINADFISEDDKKELLRRLAYRMQSGDGSLAGNFIHRECLQEEFESYLKERYNQPPDRAKVIAGAMIQQFRERNFILSLYGANLYGFVHRAFLEYFCAYAFVWKFEKTKELTIEQLKAEVYGKHWKDQSWHEVLRLICGMIDERWAGKIIEYLLKENHQNQSPENSSSSVSVIAFAVQCFGEVGSFNKIYELGCYLLKVTLELFEKGISTGSEIIALDFERWILPVIKMVSTNWPNREYLVDWLENRGAKDLSFYSHIFDEIITYLGQNLPNLRDLMFDYAHHSEKNNRLLAIHILTQLWESDRETPAILERLAQNDIDNNVRLAATLKLDEYSHKSIDTVYLLYSFTRDISGDIRYEALKRLIASHLDDSEILKILQERVFDDDELVSDIAIDTIIKNFSNHPDTLPLLIKITKLCKDRYKRNDAIETLAKSYPNDDNVLPLIRNLALNDQDELVRFKAVETLASYFGNNEFVQSELLSWAQLSNSEEMRYDATYSIATHLIDKLETRTILRQSAINDSNPEIRKLAIQELAKSDYEKDKSFSLLCDRAVSDQNATVRSAAIFWINRRFSDVKSSVQILCDRAVNDLSPSPDEPVSRMGVRIRAIHGLITNWYFLPETLTILNDCMHNDPNPHLRKRAQRYLEEIVKRQE